MGLGVGANYASVLSYYVTYICSVTLQALSEKIPPIWFNVNIDYLAGCQILFCTPGGNYQDYLKWVLF